VLVVDGGVWEVVLFLELVGVSFEVGGEVVVVLVEEDEVEAP
jgi:hypothetical protein